MENKELTLQQSISKIQTNTKLWLEKKGKNNFAKYDYFKESEVYEVIKKEMANYNLSILIERVGESQLWYSEQGKKWIYKSAGILYICKDKEKIELYIDLVGDNSDAPKSMGSALTYAMKYWLSKIFLLPTDELDPDNDKNTPKTRPNNTLKVPTTGWMLEKHQQELKQWVTDNELEQCWLNYQKNNNNIKLSQIPISLIEKVKTDILALNIKGDK